MLPVPELPERPGHAHVPRAHTRTHARPHRKTDARGGAGEERGTEAEPSAGLALACADAEGSGHVAGPDLGARETRGFCDRQLGDVGGGGAAGSQGDGEPAARAGGGEGGPRPPSGPLALRHDSLGRTWWGGGPSGGGGRTSRAAIYHGTEGRRPRYASGPSETTL